MNTIPETRFASAERFADGTSAKLPQSRLRLLPARLEREKKEFYA